MHVVYLHGFLSSTKSEKAKRLHALSEKYDFNLYLHELYPTEQVFTKMTIQSQVNQLKQAFDTHDFKDYALVGSSYGGLISLNFLATYQNQVPKPKGVLLLAPALDFPHINIELLKKPVLNQWKTNKVITFFHPGINKEIPLEYSFYESLFSSLGESTPPPHPTIIIHGTKDDTVPLQHSKRFTEKFPYVKLVTVNDDHRLTNSFPVIEQELIQLLKT